MKNKITLNNTSVIVLDEHITPILAKDATTPDKVKPPTTALVKQETPTAAKDTIFHNKPTAVILCEPVTPTSAENEMVSDKITSGNVMSTSYTN